MTTLTIQVRRGTAAAWTSNNPTLAAGEPGFETDTGKLKIGNGTDAWADLDYIEGTGGGGGDATAPTVVVTPTTDDPSPGEFTATIASPELATYLVDASGAGDFGELVLPASTGSSTAFWLISSGFPVGDAATYPIKTAGGSSLGDLYAPAIASTDDQITFQVVPFGGGWFGVAVSGGAAGGGAVDSVNGQTGTVVLDASDVGADPAGSAAAVTTTSIGAVPTSRTVSAGTGLTGGGDLSTDRTLAVSFGTTAGTVAAGDDARIAGAAPLASPTFTGTPAAPTAAVGTSTTQIATTAFVQALDGAPTAKVTGLYYAPVGVTSGGQLSPFTAAGVMAATPIFLWAGTYTGVGNAYYYGTGTATIRLGLYNRTGTAGLPGSLVSGGDFGTFTCTAGAAGAKEISISFTLATSGWYWIAGLCDAYTSTPDFVGFSNTNAHGPIRLPGFPATGDSNNASCITRTGVTTGSMPSSFGTPSNYAGTRFPAFRMYLSS